VLSLSPFTSIQSVQFNLFRHELATSASLEPPAAAADFVCRSRKHFHGAVRVPSSKHQPRPVCWFQLETYQHTQ
jgi:hypothetical protein